jgi:hypothetical protein
MMVGVKLSGWARLKGVSRQSACRWFRAGVLPVPARQLATGTILAGEPPAGRAGVVVYARVSSGDQRAGLGRQVVCLAGHAAAMGVAVSRVVSEVGSGLNGHRAKLLGPLPWTLPALRRAWNQAKQSVAPWWADNSKESYNSGLDALARGPDAWAKSRRGARKGRRVGFPRFKKKNGRRSFKVTTGAFGVTDSRHVRLPRIGVIRTKEPTTKLAGLLDIGAARVLSATVSEQAGRWYVAFGVEVTRPGHRAATGPAVGVDVGVKALAVLSTGEVIEIRCGFSQPTADAASPPPGLPATKAANSPVSRSRPAK